MSPGTTRSSRRQAKCAHESTMTVRSHRVERRICEGCAHVSFSIIEEELIYGRRDKFARDTDQELALLAG